MTVSPATVSLAVGATQQFSAAVADASGNAITGTTLTWATSAASVATVSSSGLVTAVSAGTANITAATGGVTSAAAVVTVTAAAPAVASITVAPATATVAAGATQQFTATAKDAAGNTLSGISFTWASSSTATATVASNGLATGVAAGAANITATAAGITSAPAALTVTAAAVASVTVAPAAPTVAIGATQQFTATAKDASGNTLTGITFTWASSSAATATIAASGLATGVAAGTTNITATAAGITSAPVTLTVTNAQGLAISGAVTLNQACGAATAVPGVTVSINTTPVQTVTTDNNGDFSIPALTSGSYTLTPTLAGTSAAFYPATQAITLSGASKTSANFAVSLGYTVSGTVAYSGSATGRIYLVLSNNNCSGSGDSYGTSIAAPGAFAIHGVAPGTYTLRAWMDTLGTGAINAADPSGSVTSVPVTFNDATGANVTMTNPGAVSFGTSAPQLKTVAGMSDGVMVQYTPVTGSDGTELAGNYILQWSTTQDFSSVTGFHAFLAHGNTGADTWFLNSATDTTLTNGSIYYFRVEGTAGIQPSVTASPWSNVVGPVTIGAPAGGNAITGTVTFSNTATGPLYTGFYDLNTGAFYGEYFATPVSPQSYSIQVPSGSSYFQMAVLDQDSNGMINAGDVSNVPLGSYPAGVAISGAAVMNLTLTSANSSAAVTTNNIESTTSAGTSQSYALNFSVAPGAKLPVAVELTSGPNVVAPLDLAVCGTCGTPFQYNANIGTTAPSVGDSYALNVTYSDGTSDTLHAAVSGVLTAFATNLLPAVGTSTTTTPTFTWTDPASAGNYTYKFQLFDPNSNTIWQIPGANAGLGGFGSSTTSITWNTDPTGGGSTPTVAALTSGLTYSWQIQVQDSNGNTATQLVTFMP